MGKLTRRQALGGAIFLAAASGTRGWAQAGGTGDWPQWRGAARDGLSTEKGLLKTWPQGGPRGLWKAEALGYGYGSPSVAGGKIYGLGYQDGEEFVWALDAATGKSLWRTPFSRPQNPDPDNRGAGPRSSPTVDGNRLYVEGVNADVACLDAKSGKILWQKNLVRDFGGAVPVWGYSESPLVDGDHVLFTPGGQTATVVALAKATGETAWKCAVPGGDGVAYASMIAATLEDQRQYIQFTKGGVIGVSAQGQFLWRFPHAANNVANCPTPIYKDGHVFAAAGYGKGASLGKISKGADGWSVEAVYQTPRMTNHHGGVVLVGDYLYGLHDAAGLTCMEFKTGEVKWSDRNVPKGSLIYADGNLYTRRETTGQMVLVEANPAGLVEKGRFDPPRDPNQPPARPAGMAWAHPVIAGGHLLLRDQNWLLCYDIKG